MEILVRGDPAMRRPFIVMEAIDTGLSGNSIDWSGVQPEVAKFARACIYDRAGYGWSDSGPTPRDCRQIVYNYRNPNLAITGA
jgi:hypothetical protein